MEGGKLRTYLRNVSLIFAVALPVSHLTFTVVQLVAMAITQSEFTNLDWLWVGLIWGHGPHLVLFGPAYSVIHTFVVHRWGGHRPHSLPIFSILVAGVLSALGSLAVAFVVTPITWILYGPAVITGMLAYGWVVGKLASRRT